MDSAGTDYSSSGLFNRPDLRGVRHRSWLTDPGTSKQNSYGTNMVPEHPPAHHYILIAPNVLHSVRTGATL